MVDYFKAEISQNLCYEVVKILQTVVRQYESKWNFISVSSRSYLSCQLLSTRNFIALKNIEKGGVVDRTIRYYFT